MPETPSFAFVDLVGARRLFYATWGTGPDARSWTTVAFRPPGTARYNARLTLPESWAIDGGVYLLLSEPVEDEAAFTGWLREKLRDPSLKNIRVMWVRDPNSTGTPLFVRGIYLSSTASGGQLVHDTRFDGASTFRNYTVFLGSGCALELDETLPGFRCRIPGARVEAIYFGADRVKFPVLDGTLEIPLAGPLAGCLSFSLNIPASGKGSGAQSAFDQLDVGCRFFYPDPAGGSAGSVSSQRYRIFDIVDADISLRASLDPLAPLDATRSKLAVESKAAIASFYRTTLGRRIDLTPGPDSLLVFAAQPDAAARAREKRFYLVPDGPYSLNVETDGGAVAADAGNGELDFLCGISGTEYVKIAPSSGPVTLRFVAGHPAYTASFRSADAAPNGSNVLEAGRLSPLATTAWVALSGAAEPLAYFAQPEAAVFHGQLSAVPFLDYFPVKAGTLPAQAAGPADPEAGAACFPLVPYAGLDGAELATCRRLEAQILSPQRREIVHELNGRAAEPCGPDEARVSAVTPQGYIGHFSTDPDHERWCRLDLARMAPVPPTLRTGSGPKDGPEPDVERLSFQQIGDPLKSALLTNQQFVVISDPSSFQRYFATDNKMSIEGWRFWLEPAQWWNAHRTIVIIKNSDRSLEELVSDAHAWTLAHEFNRSVVDTQQRLANIIADAKNRAHPPNGGEGEVEFQHFADVVAGNPDWNGVLFLNAYVPLSDLPPELEGLAAGIDPSRFYGHHLGINQTPVSGDAFEMKHSSLFGLIHYEGSPGESRGSNPYSAYDFTVATLKVAFENSSVKSFSSTVAVTLGQLFGATAKRVDADGDNTLLLKGVYQKHGSEHAYVFSEDTPVVFELQQGGALREVGIDGARFSTVVATAEKPVKASEGGGDAAGSDGEEADTIESRFSFWGTLTFQSLETLGDDGDEPSPFDVFSYDSLAFSDLRLNMAFKRDAPSARQFRFDPGHVSFDGSRSDARDQSLVRHFPLKVVGMIYADSGKRPTDLGYMDVSVPLEVGGVGMPWYGLVFDLDLGTVGALASKAGFIASLAVVWSPGPGEVRAFVGLKMPGSSGARNEIAIQGILKLTMYSIQLVYSDDAFILKLNGMALSLFGKTVPSAGSFDFFIFGDPDDAAGGNTLGWYGAYLKKKSES